MNQTELNLLGVNLESSEEYEDPDMVYEMSTNADYDDFDVVYEVKVTDFDGVVHESKKLFGYRGTKSIEKKYDIPEEYCIERKDFRKIKKEDGLLKKVEKAASYIKDQDDLNGYFGAVLQRAFYRCNANSTANLAKVPNLSKLYNLYSRLYTGDEKITKEDLCKYVDDTNKSIQRGVAIGTGANTVVTI